MTDYFFILTVIHRLRLDEHLATMLGNVGRSLLTNQLLTAVVNEGLFW